jgi:hypothetical protein
MFLTRSFNEWGSMYRRTKIRLVIFQIVETTGMLENEYRRVELLILSAEMGNTVGTILDAPLFEKVRKSGGKKRKIRLV